MKRLIPVYIAGQRYLVRSDADESYVQGLASKVDAQVNALKGTRQVATQADVVLAALLLADELSHERKQQRDLRRQVKEQAQRMATVLDQIMAHAPGASGP